jgi:hypothetical protein
MRLKTSKGKSVDNKRKVQGKGKRRRKETIK